MHLQTTTDYGIRVMCYLYDKDRLITATELSEKLGISYPYLIRVLGRLRQTGMIEVARGRFGGYRITKSARDSSLYDIIKTMEGEIWINFCLNKDGDCTRNAIDTCPVHKILESAQEQLIASLDRVRLSDIASISWNGRTVAVQ
ncbi:RrF2 family transcriptional regulator [Desulforamulus aeronauticus]|uniref:Transcriptional regulator, BadM/Rrf2 family n=1 Tax=Desulforamulus aeronauticus DSM 10349 TaxID=1121421 RepID=A0A1M6VTD7_9FIRM|nr:Rrf2 family transcriptional regulator [Desulforamulus aeronauticus]SHK84747.1 transcriptional regulator, BadM/Rrf2 family [Desulforamulus aeronauticus DSM 10349]